MDRKEMLSKIEAVQRPPALRKRRAIPVMFSFLVLPFLISGCQMGGNPNNLEVSSQEGDGWTRYEVVSKTNNIKIETISFNRGNCDGFVDEKKLSSNHGTVQVSMHLKYGEQITGYASCKISELDIKTDNGAFSYNF